MGSSSLRRPMRRRWGMTEPALLLTALHFAAWAHRHQRRKGVDASPYINHPIEVAHILSTVGGVDDPAILSTAVLHDTLEDTEATAEDLERLFGPAVRRMVEEVTDDTSLGGRERKRIQVEEAAFLSHGASLVKLADKIANVRDILHAPPEGWPGERRRRYLEWTERVVDELRGTHAGLERRYDDVLAEARASLGLAESGRAATADDQGRNP